MKNWKVIGITGGIGAGKSLLAKIYAEKGYPVFSADQIAKEVLAKGTEGWQEVVDAFGSEIVGKDGEIQRSLLRERIAKNPAERKKLDSITHPKIQARSSLLFQQSGEAGNPIIFYEAPLLFEAKSDKKMDAVICVFAPDSLRIQRTMARDGRSESEIKKLLESQMPQEEKKRLSKYTIENAGSKKDLENRALALLEKIQKEIA